MASTSPSGQPSKKQSETSKSKQPGLRAGEELLCSSWGKLATKGKEAFYKGIKQQSRTTERSVLEYTQKTNK